MAPHPLLAPYAWSLLLAAGVVVFSIVPLGAGRSRANFQIADLAAPRAMFERLPAWGQRAAWAHQNCFEAFSLHAPAALLCLLAGPSSGAAVAAACEFLGLDPLQVANEGKLLAIVPSVRALVRRRASIAA